MRTRRWIYLPLIMILAYVLPRLYFGSTKFEILMWLIYGAIVGFVTVLWSNSRARKITGRDDEEIYKVRQQRNTTVLLNYRRAFELCKEAVNSLNPAEIKVEDFEKGVITLRTRFKFWSSIGHIITVNLRKINENLTEIEINTRPIPRTVLVSDGSSWKYVEDFCNFLKEKDAEINQKVLADSAEILQDVYVKPFQKEKV